MAFATKFMCCALHFNRTTRDSEVTNQGHDRSQLAPMALKAQEATGCEQVTALADRGYFSGAGSLETGSSASLTHWFN
jgi:hypothetical protein